MCIKSQNVAEELILLCVIHMCNQLLGESEAKKLKTIPLSNDTVHQVCDMSDDLQHHSVSQQAVVFHLQLDECTNVANHAILLLYVRHVWNDDLEEQFLFNADLPKSTTVRFFPHWIHTYMHAVGLSWTKCTRGGAASMTGKHSGAVKFWM